MPPSTAPAPPKGPFLHYPFQRLRYARERAGISPETVAEKAGMSLDHYLGHEEGRGPIHPQRLTQYAEILGVSPQWLHRGGEEREK